MRQFSPNEVVIREDEAGETAYVIEKGKVEVSMEKGGRRVHIAFLGVGETFGEMSMVDDMPRSATVTAIEPTLVREIHRDDLHVIIREHPDTIINILKDLFERLREANTRIAQTNAEKVTTNALEELSTPSSTTPHVQDDTVYTIEGLTPEAIGAISQNPFKFKTFPCKIGRKSRDPIVSNHLEIEDQAPLQVSRHHVNIIKDGDRIGVVDRGSQLGAGVDGVRIGGKHSPGPVYFKGQEGTLVLGPESSPYRFKITLA